MNVLIVLHLTQLAGSKFQLSITLFEEVATEKDLGVTFSSDLNSATHCKEVYGLGPGHIVLDGNLAPPKGAQPHVWPTSVVAKWLDGSGWHLV